MTSGVSSCGSLAHKEVPSLETGSPRKIHFIQVLGSGSFGTVYLADLQGESDFVQRVAVKVLNDNLHHRGDLAGRHRDEARLLAQLNHDNIVKVYDLTELNGRSAVIMEYVEGLDTHTLLAQGAYPPRAALQIASAVAGALHAAFNANSPRTNQPLRVIHRDIKPANILLSAHGGVKVLDFGIARADFDREGQTLAAHHMGSPRYMAPEIWLYKTFSSAVDVYALGITLYELISAKEAFRPPLHPVAFEACIREFIEEIGDAEWPTEWRDELRSLLSDMLAFDPADRISTQEVRDRALELADSAPGERLGRFARSRIPALLKQQRESLSNISIQSSLIESEYQSSSNFVGAASSGASQDSGTYDWEHGSGSKTLEPASRASGASRPPPQRPNITSAAVPSMAHEAPERSKRRKGPILLGGGALAIVLFGVGGWYLQDPPSSTAQGSEEAIAVAHDVAEPPPPDASAEADNAPKEQEAPREEGEPAGEEEAQDAEEEPGGDDEEPDGDDEEPGGDEAPEVVDDTLAPSAAAEVAVVAAPIEPEPVADTVLMNFGSSPAGAEVYIDGARVGPTPIRKHPLTPGRHDLMMSKDGLSNEGVILVSEAAPNTVLWSVGKTKWRLQRELVHGQ